MTHLTDQQVRAIAKNGDPYQRELAADLQASRAECARLRAVIDDMNVPSVVISATSVPMEMVHDPHCELAKLRSALSTGDAKDPGEPNQEER